MPDGGVKALRGLDPRLEDAPADAKNVPREQSRSALASGGDVGPAGRRDSGDAGRQAAAMAATARWSVLQSPPAMAIAGFHVGERIAAALPDGPVPAVADPFDAAARGDPEGWSPLPAAPSLRRLMARDLRGVAQEFSVVGIFAIGACTLQFLWMEAEGCPGDVSTWK
jgi:hypothetical protein